MEMVVTVGAIKLAELTQVVTTNKRTSHFLQVRWHSCRSTNSVKTLKGKHHFCRLAHPNDHLGGVLLTLFLTTKKAPGYLLGGLPSLLSAIWCQFPNVENWTVKTNSKFTIFYLGRTLEQAVGGRPPRYAPSTLWRDEVPSTAEHTAT